MNPVTDIHDAIKAISAHEGIAEEFELPLSDVLFDPAGINMAIITDSILEKGWEPDGFVQKDGCRIYRYKAAQSEPGALFGADNREKAKIY